jgi:hypothetical protein
MDGRDMFARFASDLLAGLGLTAKDELKEAAASGTRSPRLLRRLESSRVAGASADKRS